MATYDLTHSQVSDLVQGTGLFSDPEWSRILNTIEKTGVFAPGSTSGDKAHVKSLVFGKSPGPNSEILFYHGTPQGPVTDNGGADVTIFATNEDVTAKLHDGGVIVTAGGDDNITITGNSDDTVYTGAGTDMVSTGAGDDTVYAGAGNDTLDGGAGNDHLSGEAGDDWISGGAGNDMISGGDGDDWLSGGAGDDTIYGGSGSDSIEGGAGSDRLFGQSGDDTIDGGAGADSIDGGAGDDYLIGGAGADTLVGGIGDDTMEGGSGDDVFRADGPGAGEDSMDGGSGADQFFVDVSDDTVVGGSGFDTLHITNFASTDAKTATTEGDVTTWTFDDGSTISFSGIEKIIFHDQSRDTGFAGSTASEGPIGPSFLPRPHDGNPMWQSDVMIYWKELYESPRRLTSKWGHHRIFAPEYRIGPYPPAGTDRSPRGIALGGVFSNRLARPG